MSISATHFRFLDELIDEASALAGCGKLRAENFDEFSRRAQRQEEAEFALSLRDLRHPKGFTLDKELREYTIYWGGYVYPYDLDRLKTPIEVLGFLHHIGGKGWEGITGRHIKRFIESVAREHGWDIYRGTTLPPRTTENDAERAKLTPQLRYRVLKRDGFRCRTCGSGPEQGAVLHIDHRVPIAKGGLTEFENLQALCVMCNQGKGATK